MRLFLGGVCGCTECVQLHWRWLSAVLQENQYNLTQIIFIREKCEQEEKKKVSAAYLHITLNFPGWEQSPKN